MSILIKGMEMPKKPGAYSMKIRLFVKEDGTASIWGLEEYIPHEPLDVIPVPPHGRLIDADEIPYVESEDGCMDDYAYRYDINELPTIITAEEGET